MQLFLELNFKKLYMSCIDSTSTSFRASKDTLPVVSDKNLQQTRSRVSHGKFCQWQHDFHMGNFVRNIFFPLSLRHPQLF